MRCEGGESASIEPYESGEGGEPLRVVSEPLRSLSGSCFFPE